jgi:hypothetical protein
VRQGEREGGGQLQDGAVAEVNLLVEAHLPCQLWRDRGNLGDRKMKIFEFDMNFQLAVLLIRIRDPGSGTGCLLTPGSGIRDPE